MPEVWRCPFSIDGLDEPCDLEARGGDSLAALLDAIAAVRNRLDASGLHWAWPDGKEAALELTTGAPHLLDRAVERLDHDIDAALGRDHERPR